MTAEVQPCDQGIIQNFKAKYTKKFIRRIMLRDEAGYDNLHTIDQLEAMIMIEEAWNEVSQDTIKNCWRHAKILPGSGPDDIEVDDATVDETIEELQAALKELSLSGVVRKKNLMTVEELLNVAKENITEAEWTEDDIVQEILAEKAKEEGKEKEADEDDGDYEPLMTMREASHALAELERLCQVHVDEPDFSQAIPILCKLRGNLQAKREARKSQKEIGEFWGS